MGKRGPVVGQTNTVRQRETPTAPPQCPARLPAGVKRHYRRLGKVLELGPADESMLSSLSQGLWLQELAVAAIEKDGLLVKDTAHGDGTDLRRHPALIAWRTAAEVVRAAAMRLGASPLDRQRLPAPDEGDSLAKVLWGDR